MTRKSICILALLAAITPAEAAPKARPGDTLGYPCWLVRWAVDNFSPEYIEAEAKKRKMTPEQRRQAQACLKDK